MVDFRKSIPEDVKYDDYVRHLCSDGKNMIIYYGDGHCQVLPYNKDRYNHYLNKMDKQYRDASNHGYCYEAEAEIKVEQVIGGFLGLGFMGGCTQLPGATEPVSAIGFIGATSLVFAGTLVAGLQNLTRCGKLVDAIRKYDFYNEYRFLINGYIKKLFNEEKDKEGYEPNYITVNDLDKYSLEELQELVEGIQQEYKEEKSLKHKNA